MKQSLELYKKTAPEIVFEWNDSKTEAKGWVVINSLRGGAAGGGTRMRKGLTKSEVISLAKVMEIKFTVAGPPIGGAKSGIDFDPRDPRRDEVLARWYQAVIPLLKNYYGTGGDLNVDEIKDVVPLTERLGLWHPQEGVVSGHLDPTDGAKIKMLGQLRHGCAKIIEDAHYAPISSKIKYAVADMITGYGVSESIVHYYDLFHRRDLRGKRVIIQGWGNVASAAGYYLSQAGAKIVGIIDRAGGVIEPDGMSFEEVTSLFVEKRQNQLASDRLISFEEVNEQIWDVGAEIFVPGAASKLLTRDQIDRLIAAKLEVISCGANVPFVDDAVFFGPTALYTDSTVSLIPDFIANCGMARVFAYFMSEDAQMTDAAIFSDVSQTIRRALQDVQTHESSRLNLSQSAVELALSKLNA